MACKPYFYLHSATQQIGKILYGYAQYVEGQELTQLVLRLHWYGQRIENAHLVYIAPLILLASCSRPIIAVQPRQAHTPVGIRTGLQRPKRPLPAPLHPRASENANAAAEARTRNQRRRQEAGSGSDPAGRRSTSGWTKRSTRAATGRATWCTPPFRSRWMSKAARRFRRARALRDMSPLPTRRDDLKGRAYIGVALDSFHMNGREYRDRDDQRRTGRARRTRSGTAS